MGTSSPIVAMPLHLPSVLFWSAGNSHSRVHSWRIAREPYAHEICIRINIYFRAPPSTFSARPSGNNTILQSFFLGLFHFGQDQKLLSTHVSSYSPRMYNYVGAVKIRVRSTSHTAPSPVLPLVLPIRSITALQLEERSKKPQKSQGTLICRAYFQLQFSLPCPIPWKFTTGSCF